ncbi:hypothetical protein DITRI_Ditri14bG0131200 [Diplodiscus trichospermus]
MLFSVTSFLFYPQKKQFPTSILSTRWRYLFASVPNLDLDDSFLSRPKRNRRRTVMEFRKFVDRVLLFRTATNLEKLCLKISKDTSRVYRWISVATTVRHVRQLDLCISKSQQSIKLPDVLFTCKTLVVLKLNIHAALNVREEFGALYVPDEVCLPNLKCLHLDYTGFFNDSIQRLISSCIILEDFFISCFGLNISQFNICHPFLKRLTIEYAELSNTRIVIDAPSLVYLEYDAKIAAGYSLRNLHSLVKANITPFPATDAIQAPDFLSANEFFRGIANVESLILGKPTLALLLCCESLPLFHKLVELKIEPYFITKRHEKGFFDLLQSVPNLEKLSFPYEVFRKLLATHLPEIVHSSLLYNLMMIEISLFYRNDPLEYCKYFLKNASVLKKLTIHTIPVSNDGKLKIAAELLASPRKSEKWSILVV